MLSKNFDTKVDYPSPINMKFLLIILSVHYALAISPPIATRKEYRTQDGRIDYYHWLRDPKWPNVQDKDILDYLIKENEYTNSQIPKDLEDKLFEEMKGRIAESDWTVPYLDGDYYYYSYILKDQQYWIFARKKKDNGTEEILLDENLLAKNQTYLSIMKSLVSPDHTKLLYAIDLKGDEIFTACVKDLKTNEIIDHNVDKIIWSFEFDELGDGFFYTPQGKSGRSHQVFYHKLGTGKNDDKLIMQESDIIFPVYLSKSQSKSFIFIRMESFSVTEIYFIDSKKPLEKPKVIHSRENKHAYSVEHHGDYFYLRINDTSPNFRVVQVPIDNPSSENWKEFVEASSEKYIKNIFVYENYLVLLNVVCGLGKLEIINFKDKSRREITIEDASYDLSIDYTTFDDKVLRYAYSSFKKPKTVIDYDLETGDQKVMKTDEIPSGFDASKYALKREWADIETDVKVPITVIYNINKTKLDGSDPLFLVGYGNYGIALYDYFDSNIFSLLDRGFIYAVAHIRGGDECGKDWYESAKFLNKKNTFTDFIQSAERLIELKYTSQGNIVILGQSAGGLLIGYCVNNRPELFKAAIAQVPFVDLMNTMLDDSLPLTAGEFDEWGNPKEEKFYNYMLSYSPYDNVKTQNYPPMLVLAGLQDRRVTYWEPAKWVALLRHEKTDNNLLLLKTEMSAGHSGPSGRYNSIKDYATIYAFILHLYNLS